MNKKITILMIGPGETESGGGGIATYANMLTKNFEDRFIVKRITTLQHNNFINKILRLLISLIEICVFSFGNDKKIAHINTAHNNSFVRKSILIRLLKILKIPIIIHLHSSEFHNYFRGLSEKKKESVQNIFKMADKVIVLSMSWKNWYIENIDNKNEPIVIYNGMEDHLNSNDKVSNRQNKILFMGRLGERKGTYDLIKAFSEIIKIHNDAKLILAGDGDIEECKILVNSLGINSSVEFLGWINSDTKKMLLNTSKIFTLPSYNEGFPLSILEAMSSRLAIVSSKAGGIPEEVKDKESALLIDAGAIKELSSYFSKIISDDKLCDNLGNNARERYLENFTIKKILNDIEIVYLSIIKNCDKSI